MTIGERYATKIAQLGFVAPEMLAWKIATIADELDDDVQELLTKAAEEGERNSVPATTIAERLLEES